MAFQDRFAIYDFSRSKAFFYEYQNITGVSRNNAEIKIDLLNRSTVSIKINLSIQWNMAVSLFSILTGMTAGGNSVDKWRTRREAREVANESNAEADAMIRYLDIITSFFCEAMEGTLGNQDAF